MCLLAYVDEHVPVGVHACFLRVICVCVGTDVLVWLELYSISVCVYVCVQTQPWLALRLITRYSQLLITQHLFCPRSTLFCAYYQPGSLRKIRRRALSNTLLLKSPSSAVFSLALRCRGHLCRCLLQA